MKKIITVFAFLALTSACNTSNDDDHDKGSTPGPKETKLVDTTDYRVCDQGPRATDIEGAWMQTNQGGGLDTEFILQIDNGTVQATQNCHAGGRSLSATVWTSAKWDDSNFAVLGRADKVEKINESDFHMNCEVHLKPMKVQYSFKGSCLVMKNPSNNETLTMIPAN